MSNRYIGKIIKVIDGYSAVVNLGSENSTVKNGDKFLIVGLGEIISDPDTGEELEQLEIIRGRATVTHIQAKIATIESFDYEKSPDIKETTKSTPSSHLGMLSYYLDKSSITEIVRPGDKILKELKGVKVGDHVIKIQ